MGLKPGCQWGCVPAGDFGENLSLPFPASEGSLHPWPMTPSSTFTASNHRLGPSHTTAFCFSFLYPLLLLLRTTVITLDPPDGSG